jgi:rhodanese-related sulfurtransferase
MTMASIDPESLHRLVESGKRVNVIDVRTPAEFQEVHVKIARNVPLDALEPSEFIAQRNGGREDPLYIICGSGNRATQACRRLLEAGFPHVVNVAGGTQAWDQAELPVVRGRRVISLERQVRLTAGGLALLGALLALLVHPWFAVLPAFIGAGLIYSGVTDTCPMGSLLARMPWNQTRVPDLTHPSAS